MLSIQNLSATFSANGCELPAVRNVDFSLNPGERLGIIGESGCGKTTLAMAVMGLLPQAKIEGNILMHGQDLTSRSPADMRKIRWRQLAIVFQNNLEIFNPVLPLAEQLIEPLLTHLDLEKKEALERIKELLAATGLEPRWLDAYPHQLSGGMRQRALIAMALGCRPELLIVDEPTTSLDPANRCQVLKMLDELQMRYGFAMIMISHSLPAIRQLTDRMLTMYHGRVVEEGPTRDVIRKPLHPYTRGLINAAADLFPYKDLWGIPGEPSLSGASAGCSFAPRCCQTGKTCAAQVPELRELRDGRRIACHKGGIETILSAEAITKNYTVGDEQIKALRGVSLQVRRGEVVALVGSSGSGKSTLAQIMAQMVAADGGIVRFNGKPVYNHEATCITGGLQLVCQDPAEAVSHRFTVLEAVREPLDIMGAGDRPTRDQTAIENLTAVHLPVTDDFLHRTCHSLSGGQRQRVAIARALVTQPLLLIADEITAMLDPSTQAVILRELKGLQHSRGFSMLFISHDLALARKVADRVYVLDMGFIVEEGSALEVFGEPATAQQHLSATRKN